MTADEPQTEHTVVRIVVIGLVAVTVFGMGAMTWLISVHANVSDVVVVSSPTTTALGALCAMLVSTRSVAKAALPEPPPPAV